MERRFPVPDFKTRSRSTRLSSTASRNWIPAADYTPFHIGLLVRHQGLIFGCGCSIVTRSVSEDEWRLEVPSSLTLRVTMKSTGTVTDLDGGTRRNHRTPVGFCI